jgi:hypothetical protein
MCDKPLDLSDALAAMGFICGGELMEGVTVYRLAPRQDSTPQTQPKESTHEHE